MSLQHILMGNLKKYRKQVGFTQEKLAELCETDPCYITQMETGRRCPSIAFLEKIAAALNIAPFWLFYDPSDTSAPSDSSVIREQLLAMHKDAFTNALIDDLSGRIRALTDQYL
jgi:transcriptional regulator with XRE-family HTH domain